MLVHAESIICIAFMKTSNEGSSFENPSSILPHLFIRIFWWRQDSCELPESRNCVIQEKSVSIFLLHEKSFIIQ